MQILVKKKGQTPPLKDVQTNKQFRFFPFFQKTPILVKQNKIIFSDEAHFHLGGYVNKQNCRICSTENPHAYIEMPAQPKRVTVWCGFWSSGVIASFLFENEQRDTKIQNSIGSGVEAN